MIEEPHYEMILKEGKFELRDYGPVLLAETAVEADFNRAGNTGFRRLAAYIFGKNQRQETIAMTAPVSQTGVPVSTSAKIPMTARVGQEKVDQNHWIISFSMPAKYDLKTIPVPTDKGIKLREIPPRTVAAIRYSGTWSQARYRRKLSLLQRWLRKNDLQPQASPVFARYNPPWTLWFLRRNEILVQVQTRARRESERL